MMNEIDTRDQPIEPQLEELLELLRETPSRNLRAVEAGRAKFLADIAEISPTQLTARKLTPGSFSSNQHEMEDKPVKLKMRLALSFLIAILFGCVFLLYGAGATVYAAQSALPGDALYPVKTGLEQTRLALAGDAYDQAQLHLGFAQHRLDEIANLIDEGRYQDVNRATAAFETDVQKAIAAFQVVANNDSGRSGELATQIAGSLSRYAQILSTMAISAPEVVRAEVENALQFTVIAHTFEINGVVEAIMADAWMIDGNTILITPQTEILHAIEIGDFVEIHAVMGADNSLIAVRIALGDDLDDGEGNENSNEGFNENQNDNANGHDNTNANQNTNGDDNENGNANQNEANANENTNINDNANQNGNTNENDNEEEANTNENSNANANQNDNGSTGNVNANDNDNQNDNGGNSSGNDNDNEGGGNDNGNSNGGGNDNGNSNGGGGNENGDD